MGFDSPLMLLGLIGVAVPIAIHLHVRRNAPVVVMDAVMLLVLAGGRTHLRLRAIHALLLAARVLVVILVALLFARPFLERPAEPGVLAEHPVALGLVLDDSMSMRLAYGDETAWTRARGRALRALSELPSESEVWVVLAGSPQDPWPGQGPGADPDSAVRYVSRLQPRWSSTDLAGAARTAVRLVRTSAHHDRRLVVASDFFDHGLRGFQGDEELAGITAAAFDVGPVASAPNRAVVEATPTPAPDVSPGHIRVRAVIDNESGTPFEGDVTVRVGRSGSARHLACPARARCPIGFLVGVEEGARWGEVRLPPDDLPDDDVRYFTLAPRNAGAVLVVDGAPRRRPDLDEAFFLSRALAVRSGDDPGFSVTTVRPDEMSPLHLSVVGSVALLNVSELRPEQVAAIRDFVAGGGGVFVSMGDGVDPAAWGEMSAALLPAVVRDFVDTGTRGDTGSRVTWVQSDHPALGGLESGPGSLATVTVGRVAVLDDGWAAGSTTLATLEGGLPLLVERRIGRGSVMALLTTIDRDWTDMPLRPAYPVFVRRVFAYLAALGVGRARQAVLAGEPRRVELPPGFDHAVVTPPSGVPVLLAATDDFLATATPGAYRVDLYQPGRPDPARTDTFVSNPDPAESVLSRTTGVPPALAGHNDAGPQQSPAPVRRVGLWPPLLVAVLVLLLAEAWLRGKA